MSEHNNYSPIRSIDVSGNASERGRQIGYLAGESIALSLHNYRNMFNTCDISWQQACDKALPCIDYANRYCPSVIEEMEGIANGSNTDIASIAALNTRTEILPADYLAKATGPDPEKSQTQYINECTSLAFAQPATSTTDKKTVWLAQNWDWLGTQRNALIVIRATAEQNRNPGWITATEAGMLAKIGVNKHGLGITLNILRSQLDGNQTGMPVHIFLRALLDCESVEHACELAQSLRFSSSSNILIADKEGHIVSIEVSPTGARILHSDTTPPESTESANNKVPDKPTGRHHWLCHTNHFLHSELAGQDAGLTGNLSTQARLDAANAKIRQLQNLSDIKTLLSDTSSGEESICRFADKSLPEGARIETVFAAAMNLSQGELWVTAAQPSISDFECHRL